MRLREIMRPRVVTIDARESADAALSQMRKNRIRHLVVTSNGELAGVVSERDLGGRLGADARKGHRVADLMSPRVVSGEPKMTLREAANLMRGRMIGSLPVLEDGRLVGIVTATDVLDELGRGSTRPTRRPEARAERMTESRRRAARRKKVVSRSARAHMPTGRERPRQPDSPKRAPFAEAISKDNKLEPPGKVSQVPAHIRAADGELSTVDRDYIRRKLGRRLGKFARHIERVSVRTEDVNGPRGGIDHVCRIKVVLRGLPSVVFESREATVIPAVDVAVDGIETAVRRAVQRRMKPLRRAA